MELEQLDLSGFDSIDEFLAHHGFDTVEDFLAHYGILGMKWGIRRRRGPDGTVTSAIKGATSKVNSATKRIQKPSGPERIEVSTTPGKRVQTRGGRGHSPSEDAKRAAAYRQKAKASTVDSLSNKQLEALIRRASLEKQYAQAFPPTGAKAFIRKFLKDNGKELVPLGYSVATQANPKLKTDTGFRTAAEIGAMVLGGKLPKEQEKKKKD